MGTKRGKLGKLSVFYLTILNLPPSQRSKLSSIFLMRVGHTADLKKHNVQLNFFWRFHSSVKSQRRNHLWYRQRPWKVFWCCDDRYRTFFSCPLLSRFKESFGPTAFQSCWTCLEPSYSYAQHVRHGVCNLRSESEIKLQMQELKQIASVSNRKQLSKEFGINGESGLTSFPFFFVDKRYFVSPDAYPATTPCDHFPCYSAWYSSTSRNETTTCL